MQIIAVDCGRNSVKAVSGKRLSMPSVVGEWRERKISAGGDYEVTINDERCFVGELAETESRFRREMVSNANINGGLYANGSISIAQNANIAYPQSGPGGVSVTWR